MDNRMKRSIAVLNIGDKRIQQKATAYQEKLYSDESVSLWQFIKNMVKLRTPAARDFAAGYRAGYEDALNETDFV